VGVDERRRACLDADLLIEEYELSYSYFCSWLDSLIEIVRRDGEFRAATGKKKKKKYLLLLLLLYLLKI
jgi:hypothetical protein